MSETTPVLRVEDLRMWFPHRAGPIRAVDGISFELGRAETLGLVGESGCGKSTTGRAALMLHRPTGGKVWLGEDELTALDDEAIRLLRPRLQMVFQDSYAFLLNPRHSVGRIIAEPLRVQTDLGSAEIEARVRELLDLVGLSASVGDRFAHEFSGGQRQRVNIARALALRPDLIVLDEPISALDVSIQAQVINLLDELQGEFRLSYLFIAHDLSMVEHISDRVAVMYLGHIVESGTVEHLFGDPQHPYTRALLSAVPIPDPVGREGRRRVPLGGELPSPQSPPSGCVFRTRCPDAMPQCATTAPTEQWVGPGHSVSCHLVSPPQRSASASTA